MNAHDNDFDASVDQAEREVLARIGTRLNEARPVPAPSFRGQLRRQLLAREPSKTWGLVDRRRLGVALVGAGTALLLVATAGVADVGPLAPDSAENAVAWVLAAI